MDDEHYLALGKAVYAFQMVEWVVIWIAALLDDGDVTRYDGKTFGQLVNAIKTTLGSNPGAGGANRQAVVDLVTLLDSTNILRQDVFHSYPVQPDRVLRRRPSTGMVIPFDAKRLDLAAHRFNLAVEQCGKVFDVLWQQSWLSRYTSNP